MRRKTKDKPASSTFSTFIRSASAGEKKQVYKSVIKEAAKDQERVIKLAGLQR